MKKGPIFVLSTLAGTLIGATATGKVMLEKETQIQAMSDKHLALFKMMNQWVKVKQRGKNLSEYFEKEGYRNIAVYGMSYAGETLIDELENTGINIAYGIDKSSGKFYAGVEIFLADDYLEPVDAIVVTAITFYEEIKQKLSKKVDCPIISLEDILFEV